MSELVDATWPSARTTEALIALGRAARLPLRRVDLRSARDLPGGGDAGPWIEGSARWLALEAEPVDTPYGQLEDLLRGAGPAMVRVETAEGPRFVAVLRANARHAIVVTDHGLERVSTRVLREAVALPLEKNVAGAVDQMLDACRIAEARRPRARAALLREHLGPRRLGGIWMLRRPPTSPFGGQLRDAGAVGQLAALVASHATQYGLSLAAWWTIGQGALRGHLDPGWLVAWAMLLASSVPLRLLELSAQGRLAIEAAAVLKRRLLQGSLAMAPEEMRGEGAGQLLGRTTEASAVEAIATGGGLAAVMAVADLAASALVLAAAGGLVPTVMLVLATAAACAAGAAYWRARLAWTDHRLGLTHALVERMTGHRTRLAQEEHVEWHRGEDEELVRYLGASRAFDRQWVVFGALLPAAWLAAGLSSLVPSLVAGTTPAASIAVAVGGVLLAFRALQKLAAGARGVVGALIAWRRVRPLFEAGGRTENAPPPEAWRAGLAADRDQPILTAENLVFRYRAGGEAVLRGCSVRIRSRDRLLLEGPSGGGKSTLAMVLAGVRAPESGTLLACGLDRHTLGSEDWRRRVVTVPQFHENHVLSATFGFNVLMGRGWPPRELDLKEAEDVCQELGLGALLARMPAGLQQIVGETGWQLSHGERSRLYMARALLQRPDVLVLDESFAALDPQTMLLCLKCVLRRAPALVVVAHP